MIIIAYKTIEIAEMGIETTIRGCKLFLVVPKVPLADYPSSVAKFLQVLRQDFARWQSTWLRCT
jgi:hypothetical protein